MLSPLLANIGLTYSLIGKLQAIKTIEDAWEFRATLDDLIDNWPGLSHISSEIKAAPLAFLEANEKALEDTSPEKALVIHMASMVTTVYVDVSAMTPQNLKERCEELIKLLTNSTYLKYLPYTPSSAKATMSLGALILAIAR